MNHLPISLKNKKLKASFEKHLLEFITPAKTSREVFNKKETYLLKVSYEDNSCSGIGECSPLWSLSIDPRDSYEDQLQFVCENINNWEQLLLQLTPYPSILFGLETALLDLTNGGKGIILPSPFTKGNSSIQINGLIWMNSFEHMSKQIAQKIESGYRCVKLKIGAIDWEDELQLLKGIRKKYNANNIEIRVDANGAFNYEAAPSKLEQLYQLDIHSIEQPIKAGQIQKMSNLCANSPIPIALDEELIGIKPQDKENLIRQINPNFLILKPSLLGGIKATMHWIALAEKLNLKWWITSALEGNVALNAIAQIVAKTSNQLPQGLGTGGLFKNNFDSKLSLEKDYITYNF